VTNQGPLISHLGHRVLDDTSETHDRPTCLVLHSSFVGWFRLFELSRSGFYLSPVVYFATVRYRLN
jgi:hypothetical protein